MLVRSNCNMRVRKIRHEDAFTESTTSITPDDDLLLVDHVVRSNQNA